MKNMKLIKKFFKNAKINKVEANITPTKIFYIWNKNRLTKVETFSL